MLKIRHAERSPEHGLESKGEVEAREKHVSSM